MTLMIVEMYDALRSVLPEAQACDRAVGPKGIARGYRCEL